MNHSALEHDVALACPLPPPYLSPPATHEPQVLLAARAADVAHAAAYGEVPIPASHFFTAREVMERGELYPLLVRMPKGAALHVR